MTDKENVFGFFFFFRKYNIPLLDAFTSIKNYGKTWIFNLFSYRLEHSEIRKSGFPWVQLTAVMPSLG